MVSLPLGTFTPPALGNRQRRLLAALEAGERLVFNPDLPSWAHSPARLSQQGGKYSLTIDKRVPQSLFDRGLIRHDGGRWVSVAGAPAE